MSWLKKQIWGERDWMQKAILLYLWNLVSPLASITNVGGIWGRVPNKGWCLPIVCQSLNASPARLRIFAASETIYCVCVCVSRLQVTGRAFLPKVVNCKGRAGPSQMVNNPLKSTLLPPIFPQQPVLLLLLHLGQQSRQQLGALLGFDFLTPSRWFLAHKSSSPADHKPADWFHNPPNRDMTKPLKET